MELGVEEIFALIQDLKLTDAASGLSVDLSFKEQGIDSLGLFQVLLVIEERYGVRIEDEDISLVTTPSDLAAYVNTRHERPQRS